MTSPAVNIINLVPISSTDTNVEEEFISLYEAHKQIYARAVKGWFQTWRWLLVWATQLFFYGVPWLQWNGRQAVLFDLEARRFFIFGWVLYPQDIIYLAALLIISALSLFLVTAVAGRIWCGYACPQTVYTEIFMWVENKIEGDRNTRMKRDASPLSAKKFGLKAAKHFVWIAIGLWTGFTFVGYFTPIQTLLNETVTFSLGPWEGFWVLFYGFATYGNAGWMREQVCKYMCPYARFQSAMFDRDTMIISYDERRGELRGSRPKNADLKALALGDCIDCTLCVQVCPTGIDIRKGLQYECIGCAACIDVCDQVMDKMSYPRGLIRYSTQRGLEEQLTRAQLLKRTLRPRVLIYSTILLGLIGALLLAMGLRTPLKVDVVRDRAGLARIVDDKLENVYRLQIMNATERTQHYRVSTAKLEGAIVANAEDIEVGAAQSRWVPLRVQVPYGLSPGSHAFEINVEAQGESSLRVREKASFIVPR
jgi:cytochrome c oxidase accessory protein FixG